MHTADDRVHFQTNRQPDCDAVVLREYVEALVFARVRRRSHQGGGEGDQGGTREDARLGRLREHVRLRLCRHRKV